jgi:hypothetical protein
MDFRMVVGSLYSVLARRVEFRTTCGTVARYRRKTRLECVCWKEV